LQKKKKGPTFSSSSKKALSSMEAFALFCSSLCKSLFSLVVTDAHVNNNMSAIIDAEHMISEEDQHTLPLPLQKGSEDPNTLPCDDDDDKDKNTSDDLIEDAYIQQDSTMRGPSAQERAARKRKLSDKDLTHSDKDKDENITFIDPPILPDTDDKPQQAPTYNGPTELYIVMLRIANENSQKPMPQAAFFVHSTALTFAAKILLQWCEAHYEGYSWKGPESLTRDCVSRYAAFETESGKLLAMGDVVRVSIFDAKVAGLLSLVAGKDVVCEGMFFFEVVGCGCG
jgi:hypothetical protein